MFHIKTATAREVQHGFGRVLARVKRGESVVITKHGNKIARLTPVESDKLEALAWPDFEARFNEIYCKGWRAETTGTDVVSEARGER